MAAAKKIPPQVYIWVTHDKRMIRICDMADPHVVNAILLVRKTFRDAFAKENPLRATSICVDNEGYGVLFPEETMYDPRGCDDGAEFDRYICTRRAIFRNLLLEAKRRNLKGVFADNP